MSEALEDAVRDVCWKATAYGMTPDGDVAAYILPKGAIHRLVGAAQCAGISASLRSSPAFLERSEALVTAEDRQIIADALRLRDATAATYQVLPESVRVLDRLIALAQRLVPLENTE